MQDLPKKTNMNECIRSSTPMSTSVKYRTYPKLKEGETTFDDVTLYRSVTGALQYATITRLEIFYSVNRLSQFMQNPRVIHWQGCKRILRCLQETKHYGLYFTPGSNLKIKVFTDTDWATDKNGRRSTGGYCIYLDGNLVSWGANKQNMVSRSSIEAEYRALSHSTTEVVWFMSLLF